MGYCSAPSNAWLLGLGVRLLEVVVQTATAFAFSVPPPPSRAHTQRREHFLPLRAALLLSLITHLKGAKSLAVGHCPLPDQAADKAPSRHGGSHH
jgi:hypothetical protein